jgi:glyoxylase-like metal-dependent hydrolase (beta-lactamase superfamily II)
MEIFVKIETFFDGGTYTLSYVVYDIESKLALIIDPVLSYEPATSKTNTDFCDKMINFIKANSLTPRWIIETHAHADHLTAAKYLKDTFTGSKTLIGERITEVQATFKPIFNLQDLKTDGSQFDKLLKDNEEFSLGSLNVKVINTPGHTPACISLLINNEVVFTGDCLFMEDYGTGRCDFPAGSAQELYDSVFNKLYKLDDHIKTYTGHDYQPGGRELKWHSTIKIQKEKNIHLTANTTKEDFVKFRNTRDASLRQPKLILPSVQYNIASGNLDPENNGQVYFKLPLS